MNIFPKRAELRVSPLSSAEIAELKRTYVALHEDMDAIQEAIDAAVEAEKDLPKEERSAISYNFDVSLSRSTWVVKNCLLDASRKTEILTLLSEVEQLELSLFDERDRLQAKIDATMSGSDAPSDENVLYSAIPGDSIPVSTYLSRYIEFRCNKESASWTEFAATYKEPGIGLAEKLPAPPE